MVEAQAKEMRRQAPSAQALMTNAWALKADKASPTSTVRRGVTPGIRPHTRCHKKIQNELKRPVPGRFTSIHLDALSFLRSVTHAYFIGGRLMKLYNRSKKT
eukprot:COSAG02_NODE_150_length_33596_cov_61.953966_15_plen_102_part_00